MDQLVAILGFPTTNVHNTRMNLVPRSWNADGAVMMMPENLIVCSK
jgi:hypothetical protein